jgi:hypothetical protein
MNIIEKYWVSAHLRMNNDLNASNVPTMKLLPPSFSLIKKKQKIKAAEKLTKMSFIALQRKSPERE